MRIVVTGGAGFIGANLCRELAARNHHVTALDDLSTGSAANVAGIEGVELIEGSILDEASLGTVVAGAGAVVHLAARPSVPRSLSDPQLSNRINVNGTMNVLEAARTAVDGGAHVVLASSSSVYGANPALPKSEDLVPMPVSPYAVSKLAAESYGLSYQACFELPVLALRFFNVYGPLQGAGHAYAAVIPAFVDAALRGEAIPVHGDGTQTRDFTYVATVAGLIADAIDGRVTSARPVNLAFGSRISLLEVIAALEVVLDRPLEREHQPTRPGDVRDSQADQTRLRALFPSASPTSFDAGLAATVDWFRSL